MTIANMGATSVPCVRVWHGFFLAVGRCVPPSARGIGGREGWGQTRPPPHLTPGAPRQRWIQPFIQVVGFLRVEEALSSVCGEYHREVRQETKRVMLAYV